MSFNRHLFQTLKKWKTSPSRKPLIVRGARQVGKTTAIETFSKNYKYCISLNLDRLADLNFLHQFRSADQLVEALFISNNIPSTAKSDTLLFIDEIQESPKAIALLRYFYEDIPELHTIAAGSLLEHVMRRVKNFPVGRVEYLYMHPLNFSEYLEALGQQQALVRLSQVPIANFAHQALMDLFHTYAIIGGMPEVVHTYVQSKSVADLPPIYESIWATYKDDVEKFSSNKTDARVIKHIINSAHLMVDRRIKFQNFGNSNFRSREVGDALRNLDDAKIIQLIYPTLQTEPPIFPDLKKSPRLQFLDTGLLNHELGIQADLLAMEDMSHAYRGALIPHMIIQEMISLNNLQYKKPNFWVREKNQSSAEVDLIFQFQDKLIPIEIKSGKAGKLKSLHQFIERADHPYAIRLYAGKFSIESHKTPLNKKPYLLMNLPYYLSTKIPAYVSYFLNNY